MAYQTGSANSLADIQNVIQTFLTANGWTWNSGSSIIYKDQMFVKFIAPADNRVLFQGTTALSGGVNTPRNVGMGRLIDPSNITADLTFPCTYFAFLSDDEFYFIVNYDVVRYQFIAWGNGHINTGVNASGMFITGSTNELNPAAGYSGLGCGIDMGLTGNSGNMPLYGYRSAAPFWDHVQGTGSSNYMDGRNSFVRSDLGTPNWSLSIYDGSYYQMPGIRYLSDLLGVIPNVWNGESPLLPFRAYRRLAETKISLVADMKNARHCRIDNFNDQEIITIGSDQWQIFPFHKRSMTSRNAGYLIDHTGTFGWALRKVD